MLRNRIPDAGDPTPEAGDVPPLLVAPRRADSEWRWRVRLHVLILGLCAGVMLLAVVLEVHEGQWVIVPSLNWRLPETCSLRRTFGLPCPGCGMTRGFIALADGDVSRAWSYNPASIPLFAWLLLLIPYQVVQLWRIGRRRYPLTMGYWAMVPLSLLTVLMFSHWMWRVFGG